ncbi:hypothetical protein HGP14_09480 [Rhizobium sp. P32RR-XVIII]|uniref:hypothetical protein n=1 Tax=Rhizobium sp. P32RR-XVIII TaxID=2726738 RepID=UPI001457588F|nr:hypothetical protein [Rhizobium sp. P32RR-XVIII]NLS03588.1 hypothetical protein [Rhizobium sp. P32RR-XVIII]
MWNHDISSAPRGKMVQTTVRTKDGIKRIEQYRKEYILAVHSDGTVVQSYWIPPRYTQNGAVLDGNRWSGFNVGKEPIAWAPWPEFNSQSDGGEFAAVKAQGRLADPVEVEPSPSGLDHLIIDDCGGGV